ncbi:hypothetical protein ACWCQS_08950 [Streptomyces sp. NPDC002076]
MRDDTVRHQIRYLRECIEGDEALALVAGDDWPGPTDKVVSALRGRFHPMFHPGMSV